jgi:hypothetical protein
MLDALHPLSHLVASPAGLINVRRGRRKYTIYLVVTYVADTNLPFRSVDGTIEVSRSMHGTQATWRLPMDLRWLAAVEIFMNDMEPMTNS